MCMFSGTITAVSDTSIFARREGDQQCLVYAMTLATEREVAMVLPLPVALPTAEDGVRFISLEDYARFFTDLALCFPQKRMRSSSLELGVAIAGAAPLKVERVGAFDASFVPCIADFGRLDPRFRLDPAVWSKLPVYADYGFAVFQLRAGNTEVHPMALRFTSRRPQGLFFPTVHIHDGHVANDADFDHALYAQGVREDDDWELGSVLPSAVMDFGNAVVADRTRGIVQPEAPVLRRRIEGTHPNADVWVG